MNHYEYLPITETVTGIEVKNVRFNATVNLYLGFTRDPLWSKPDFNGGWVTTSWKANGKCVNKTRPELDIDVKNLKK